MPGRHSPTSLHDTCIRNILEYIDTLRVEKETQCRERKIGDFYGHTGSILCKKCDIMERQNIQIPSQICRDVMRYKGCKQGPFLQDYEWENFMNSKRMFRPVQKVSAREYFRFQLFLHSAMSTLHLKHFDIDKYFKGIVNLMMQRCKDVEYLSVTSNIDLIQAFSSTLTDIEVVEVDDDGLKLISYASNLKRLHIGSWERVNCTGLTYITGGDTFWGVKLDKTPGCLKLEDITVCDYNPRSFLPDIIDPGATDDCIFKLQHLKKIRMPSLFLPNDLKDQISIDLKVFHDVTDLALVNALHLTDLHKYFPNLQTLNSFFDYNEEFVSDLSLFKFLRDLTILNVRPKEITINFGRYGRNMEGMGIYSTRRTIPTRNIVLQKVSQIGVNLRTLHLRDLNIELPHLFKACPNIVDLEIDIVSKYETHNMDYQDGSNNDITSLQSLYVHFFGNRAKKVAETLIKNSPNLIQLRLHDRQRISNRLNISDWVDQDKNDIISTAIKKHGFPCLTTIMADGCTWSVETVLKLLHLKNPLEDIILGCDFGVDDMKAIASTVEKNNLGVDVKFMHWN